MMKMFLMILCIPSLAMAFTFEGSLDLGTGFERSQKIQYQAEGYWMSISDPHDENFGNGNGEWTVRLMFDLDNNVNFSDEVRSINCGLSLRLGRHASKAQLQYDFLRALYQSRKIWCSPMNFYPRNYTIEQGKLVRR